MRVLFMVVCAGMLAVNAMAEETPDAMKEVFKSIDNIIIRVKSGVSLNSYAESLANIKIAQRDSEEIEAVSRNYVLRDKMKEVIALMDEYAAVWKTQETDRYKYVERFSGPHGDGCFVRLSEYTAGYSLSCIKNNILNELAPLVVATKSAHYNGW